jgi:hypothetical protein
VIDVAVMVSDHLDFDVSGMLDKLLDVDPPLPNAAKASVEVCCNADLVPDRWRPRAFRVRPPAVALIKTGKPISCAILVAALRLRSSHRCRERRELLPCARPGPDFVPSNCIARCRTDEVDIAVAADFVEMRVFGENRSPVDGPTLPTSAALMICHAQQLSEDFGPPMQKRFVGEF